MEHELITDGTLIEQRLNTRSTAGALGTQGALFERQSSREYIMHPKYRI
jgi:hypothetical protein